MNIRLATESEIKIWDQLVINNPDGGSILQSAEIAELKTRGGWRPRYIMTDSASILALEKSVFGLGKLWYIIKGPGVTTIEQLDDLLPGLKAFAASNGVFLVKIEPEIIKDESALSRLSELGLIKTRNIQPNASTILLDISADPDTVMANLNQKGRHALRRAERDGATVSTVPATDENCQEMYKLYKITAEGQFVARPYEYYKKFWQGFEKAGMGQLFFAYFDGQLVAGAYALVLGKKSTYKDGASLRERPVYGVSHLLQWHVIKWAKSRGATIHDLCGSPPSDQINNENHPYYGFGRFKTSFSKNVVDFIGAYDVAIHPLNYRLWTKVGERIALRWHFWRHHESYY